MSGDDAEEPTLRARAGAAWSAAHASWVGGVRGTIAFPRAGDSFPAAAREGAAGDRSTTPAAALDEAPPPSFSAAASAQWTGDI